MPIRGREIIVGHLQNAIAAERNFEDLLNTFSKTGNQLEVKELFAELSHKARSQHERLEARLRELGGSPSTAKSAMAHMFGFAPGVAQLGHEPEEKNAQHIMMTYAAAAGEAAMYEALATVAAEAGDVETERLARQLQEEEREDHHVTWRILPDSALDAFRAVTGLA
jgi:ferritin-like metal-binding protein YciE